MNYSYLLGTLVFLLFNIEAISQPSDEDFDTAGLNLVNGTSNTIGDWTFTANATAQLVSPLFSEQGSNLNNDGGGSDRAFQWSYFGAVGVNSFGLESADGSEFDLNSFDLGSAIALPTDVTITGYRDGGAVTSAELVDLTTSDATGDISYTFVATTAGGSYGTLSFGSAYDNVDEIQLSFASTAGAEIDNIDVSAPLPVEYAYFKANLIEDHVALAWQTISEIDNSGFRVEKRVGIQNWEALGFVPGNGDAKQKIQYEYVDTNPSLNSKNYYRLAQIDWDGRVEYSNQIEVFVPSRKAVLLYPNPTAGGLQIDMGSVREHVRIRLTDLQGRLLDQKSFYDLQRLDYVVDRPQGFYLLEVFSPSEPIQIIKVLKR